MGRTHLLWVWAIAKGHAIKWLKFTFEAILIIGDINSRSNADSFRRNTALSLWWIISDFISSVLSGMQGCGQKCLSLKGCLDSGRPHAPNQCRSFDKEKAKFPKWLLRYAHNRADLWRPAQNWADVYSRFGRKGTGWKVSRLPNDSKTCGKYFPHLKTFDGPDEQQDQTTTRSTENPAEFTTWE